MLESRRLANAHLGTDAGGKLRGRFVVVAGARLVADKAALLRQAAHGLTVSAMGKAVPLQAKLETIEQARAFVLARDRALVVLRAFLTKN